MESKKDESKKSTLRIENIYPHAFWLEKFNKESHFQSTLFENYLPNTTNAKGFTPKFYSKYCDIDMTSKDYQKFIKLIESEHKNRNMNRTGLPLCQNQEYGWICKPFINLDAKERERLIKPRCRGELSEFAEKLEEQKITARPKFGGLTFKV
ncbi:uncharacterized protein LOC119082889 [Bradysia coprophila]|uniref:uncharacterized protein LOC119082889 n=1 Tax=Bradysia coprophila TaxID=38358 RepID=UPI00187DD87D|nr:uncharacterized protein LOC119082889 [Bradysia coprophila]